MDQEIQNTTDIQPQVQDSLETNQVLEEPVNNQPIFAEQLANLHSEITQDKKNHDCPTPETSDDELNYELEAANGSEDECEGNPETKFKTKNEIKNTLATNIANESFEDRYKRYKIEPTQVNDLLPVGIITTIMNENIVIQSICIEVLDLDNLLFTKDKLLLGNIDDVFGRVDDPRYTLFKDGYIGNRIKEGMINVGDTVFYEKTLTKILPQAQINLLKQMRGSDASNKFDEEVLNTEDVEFSDDEKEEAYKAENNHKRAKKKEKPENSKPKEKIEYKQHKKMNNFNSNVGMTQNGMNYINFQNPQPYIMTQQPMGMPLFNMNPGMMMPQQQFMFGMQMQNAPLQINPMFQQNQMMQQIRYTPQPLLNNQQQQMNGGFQMQQLQQQQQQQQQQGQFNRNFYQ